MNDKFYNKIEELCALQLNWDNRGAKEVSALSIKNLILLKKELDEWNFDLWQIAPGVNGDISISYKGSVYAGIVINDNTYTWFLENDFKVEGESEQPFDAKKLLLKMNDIEFIGMTT